MVKNITNIHLSSRTLGDGPILVSRFVITYGIIDDFRNIGYLRIPRYTK